MVSCGRRVVYECAWSCWWSIVGPRTGVGREDGDAVSVLQIFGFLSMFRT